MISGRGNLLLFPHRHDCICNSSYRRSLSRAAWWLAQVQPRRMNSLGQMGSGKVIAAIGLSLTSSISYILGGLLALQAFAAFGLAPFSLRPWFLAYLIAEVTMLCAMGMASEQPAAARRTRNSWPCCSCPRS
jgi:hypothetical protein